jgi:hypothetical protein
MLKRKISAAEFNGLHDEVKKFYAKEGEGYLLQADDATELKNAVERERLEKEGLKLQVTTLTRTNSELSTENVTLKNKSGDVLAIERSWEGKLAAQKNEYDGKLEKKDKQLHKVLVKKTAESLATEMAGENAHLLSPIIEARLQADTSTEDATVRILDAEGKPSAFKIEDLKKELVDSKKYGAILIANRAGGSATGNNNVRPKGIPADKKFKELTQDERIAWHKEDPAGFAKAAEESRRVV